MRADQLRHLLHAGEQDNITTQVVPSDRDAFASMSGPVTILCFELAIRPDSAAVRDSKRPEAGVIRADFAAFLRRL